MNANGDYVCPYYGAWAIERVEYEIINTFRHYICWQDLNLSWATLDDSDPWQSSSFLLAHGNLESVWFKLWTKVFYTYLPNDILVDV